jgi:putative oxidoreductase
MFKLSSVSRGRLVLISLRVVFALMFAGAAAFKLSGHPAAVQEFEQVGFGQGFRYFTAFMELVGAALLLWPRGVFVGASLLAAVCGGAFVAQAWALHGDIVHTIVMAAALLGIAWAYRPTLATLTWPRAQA